MPKGSLNRYVCPDRKTEQEQPGQTKAGLQFDSQQRLQGRGFYVCNDAECQRRKDRYQGWRRKCKGVVKV